MQLDVITIFPEYLEPLRAALLGRAAERGLVQVNVHDLRRWTHDVHQAVDDSPYGGGPGMVMKATVWGDALDEMCGDETGGDEVCGDELAPLLVVPGPAGEPFTQALAQQWATEPRIVFACGRYEGIDQRVLEDAATRYRVREVSLGDYVLIGGEAAVLVMVEAVVRLLPGVLGNAASHQQDSFSDGLLEGPAYTRPEHWRGLDVPEVLRSGDHARIAAWRRAESLLRTARRRPELLARVVLDGRDRSVLAAAGYFEESTSGTLGQPPEASTPR